MKRFMLVMFLLLFLTQSVSAQIIRELNMTLDIQEDGKVDADVFFRFTDDIKEIKLPFSGEIYDIEVIGGKCTVQKEIENILTCEPPSPFMIGEIRIHTNFKIKGMVEKQGNISYISLDVPLLWFTEKSIITVKLPAGMVLSENVILPISPRGVKITSDGKRIMTGWTFFNELPGDMIPIRIYYEPLKPQPSPQDFNYGLIVGLLIIIIIGIFFIYRKVSKRSELVLSVLNENERMIIDAIKRMKKKHVNQRRLVASSGFSKAKVSRIIKSLEERGVIKVERIGRTNRINLKKKFLKK